MSKSATIWVGTLVVLAAFASTASAFHFGPHALYTFHEQASGGRSVVVENVYLPYGGFVTVHDGTLLEGKVLESVIGVSEFIPTTTAATGNQSLVRVYLAKDLPAGNATLIAMPHNDTNGNRIYDFVSSGGTADGPYTGGPQALSGLQGDLAAFNGVVATPRTINVTASVRASDQVGSGRSVTIDHVELSSPGFVAVHDGTLLDAQGGVADPLGSVVGVSPRLAAGVYRDLVVPLTFHAQKTNTTGLVIPMVHKDSNNNGVYDFVSSGGTQDPPFTGQPGAPLTAVVATPTVSYAAGANTTYVGKATGGRLILVEEAYLPEGGFVAIHDSTLVEKADALGSVRGVSAKLPPGLHRNVAVELDRALTASGTVYVMPHKDSNGNGAYDFVTSGGTQDPPYTGGPDALSGLSGDLAGFNGVSTVGGNATRSAVVFAQPQVASDGRTAIVALADLSEAGFVAVHDDSLLADPAANVLTSVVGTSAKLNAGLHRDVTVTFGSVPGGSKGQLNVSQGLILMPHKDSNGNGVYDFVSSAGTQDPPFTTATAEGNTVNALGLNIVVALSRATTPADLPALGTPTTSTPTATSPTAGAPTSTPPAATTPAPSEAMGTPGLGLLGVAAALGAAMLVLRRRMS